MNAYFTKLTDKSFDDAITHVTSILKDLKLQNIHF